MIVEGINDTAVKVRWNPVSGIPTDSEALSYVVSHRSVSEGQRQSVLVMKTVSGSEIETVINGLNPNVHIKYQFQVVASVEVNGEIFTGEPDVITPGSFQTTLKFYMHAISVYGLIFSSLNSPHMYITSPRSCSCSISQSRHRFNTGHLGETSHT